MADGDMKSSFKVVTSHSQRVDTKREFLEKSNVSPWIREAIMQIISSRPDDPISFLAQFFDNLDEKNNKVRQVHQIISLCHFSKPSFEYNITSAYQILGTHKSSRSGTGLTGVAFKELLHLLCSSFPEQIKDRLMNKVAPRDYEVVPLDVFHSSILACLVLSDFLEQAKALFNVLDSGNQKEVDRALCKAVVSELQESLKISSKNDIMGYLEAGKRLSPDRLIDSIEDALLERDSSQKSRMHCEEFLVLIAETFIITIKPL